MGTITGIRDTKDRQKRVKIFLDGKPAFILKAELALKEKLEIGRELEASEIERLIRSDQNQRCLDTARRYLSYRPRSEFELRERLRQRGFNVEIIEEVAGKLKAQGLIDDAAFARFWADNRETFNPRSRRLTILELRQKGVDKELIDETVSSFNEEENAYKVAVKKSRSLAAEDYDTFRRRLSGFLSRRGFSYEIVSRTVERSWQELSTLKSK